MCGGDHVIVCHSLSLHPNNQYEIQSRHGSPLFEELASALLCIIHQMFILNSLKACPTSYLCYLTLEKKERRVAMHITSIRACLITMYMLVLLLDQV
jgi:hypothetical protein